MFKKEKTKAFGNRDEMSTTENWEPVSSDLISIFLLEPGKVPYEIKSAWLTNHLL